MSKQKVKTEQWGSRKGFIFAALGMAVGTGNIWRFPRIVGSNHGGAFYLANNWLANWASGDRLMKEGKFEVIVEEA